MKSYGSPEFTRNWCRMGSLVVENTVARLMRTHGLVAKTRRRYQVTTDSAHSLPLAENVLNREFEQETPDRVWLADITYIWTLEGGCTWRPCSMPFAQDRRLVDEHRMQRDW